MVYQFSDDNDLVSYCVIQGKTMNISIKLIDNGSEYIANCPELDINCYGSDRNEALRRIRAVISFYISSAKELGITINPLKDISFEGAEVNILSNEALQNNNLIN